MKKVLFSAVALLAFGFANAQEEEKSTNEGFSKGDVFVSGAVSFGSTKMGDAKSSEFTIAPKVGYFVSENIAVGGKLGYSSASDVMVTSFAGYDLGGSYTADYNSLIVGGFGRYYFTPANQFSLFAELGVDYASTTLDELDGASIDDNNKVNSLMIGAGLGMNYFVSSNFSIEAGVGMLNYSTSKLDVDGADSIDSFGFGGNWNAVTFGVNYKF
jgi:hypothetical protein